MSIIIGSARIGENGKAIGGKDGDQKQTSVPDYSGEVSMQEFYVPTKNWYVLRPKLNAQALANAMIKYCNDPNVGYNQNERSDIMSYNGSGKVNADCSELVRRCIKDALGTDVGNFTTANEKTVLLNSGLFTLVGKYTSSMVLKSGDVLITCSKGHTAIICYGSTTDSSSNSSANIKKGQQEAVNFTGVSVINGENFKIDGSRGAQTRKMAVMVLQTAINKDYNAGLAVDGSFGSKSKAALGTHYVKKGNKQYMVTAAEILMYLLGKNPNGVEYPGNFGNGLATASGKTKITANDFISYLD